MKNKYSCFASILLLFAATTVSMDIKAQKIDYVNSYENMPTYAGSDLGHISDANGNHFSIWSPMAQAAQLHLYNDGRNAKAYKTIDLTYNDTTGVWSTTLNEDLLGKFYAFQIKYNDKWLNPTPAEWARAVGINGNRGAIIDFSKTNPEGWNEDKGPEVESITDVVLYEMHHRDFSMHENSGIVNKGKFVALLENGTLSANGQKTGIDHLKELGITHVHILPSYDYNSLDEADLGKNIYNWGYDPNNYNVPEGSYSTNPLNPETRVREMKQMIKALHDAGIGVVMDVVYNHTAISQGSFMDLAAPDYYYRRRADGSNWDASGCGNETASERQQMRNFMVNSIKHWMEEYHIDGFRFDLMGIHDTETMNEIIAEARKINPSVFIYGEGWTCGESPLEASKRALKENVTSMQNVAVFSDDIRDAIKGHYSRSADKGFATGAKGQQETVKIGIVASTAHPQVDYSKGSNSKFAYANSPQQIINYVSCHDDYMLTDKLRISMPEANDSIRQEAAKLAQTIIFTSQGTPFIFAGEEVFRDKQGHHNSYNMPDSINAIDWNLKGENRELFDYYKGLIELRKSHPAFRLRTAEEIARHIRFDKVKGDNLISYSIIDNAGGDSWKEIKVIFNGSADAVTQKIAKGNWSIIAQNGKIDNNGLGHTKGGNITIAPYSALILAQ